MLINGKPLKTDNLEEVVSLIKSLPSGFSKRTAHRTDHQTYHRSKARGLADQGDALLKVWNSTKSPEKLRAAFNIHSQALQAATAMNNPLARAIALSRYAGVAFFVQGQGVDTTIKSLSEAMAICRDSGFNDFGSQFAGDLHNTIHKMLSVRVEHHAITQEAFERWNNILADVRSQAMQLTRNRLGEPIDTSVYRIEQGEVGFSSAEKIGTDFLAQCVSPVFQNPQSLNTSLPHIDHGVDLHSLQTVFDRIGYSDNGSPLSVRLVGAKIEPSSNNREYFEEVAKRNVLDLLAYLQHKNVNIISADILNEDQPGCFVVDPKTFALAEAIPGHENPDFLPAIGKAMLSEPGKPLHVAFDLNRSDKRAPVFVNSFLAQKLLMLADTTILDMYEMVRDHPTELGPLIPERIESTLSLMEAHEHAVSRITDGPLNDKLQEMFQKGLKLRPQDHQMLLGYLANAPIYVGQNAEAANTPITHFIENDLFRKKWLGPYELNLDGFSEIKFPEQALDVI